MLDFLPLFVLIPLCVFAFAEMKKLNQRKSMNYEWYKSTYPDQVKGNRVSCFVCGNEKIHARALMRRTFLREHFCIQCGKTLYYSPEQN